MVSGNSSTKKKIKYLGHCFNQIEQFFFSNEREIFKVLFDSKSFYVYRSKVSSFYEPMICLRDIAHYTFTLGELVAVSMLVKELVAPQVRQLCLFTIPQIKNLIH